VKFTGFFIAVFAAIAAAEGAYAATAPTLVAQTDANMTAAKTTTVTGGTAGNYTFTSSFMNDPTGATNKAALGVTGTATNGLNSATFSGITYNTTNDSPGDVYSTAAFLFDTGVLGDSTATANSTTAGLAFRFKGSKSTAASTYYVGVDLAKIGDVAAVTATSTAGVATIDFVIGATFSGVTTTTATTAKIFVAGVSGTGNTNSSNIVIASGDATKVQFIDGTSGGSTIGTSSYLTATGSNYLYVNGAGTSVTFGALYTEINNALVAIYGGNTTTQWNTGDTVRFVPLSVNGYVTSNLNVVSPTGTNADFMGGTMNTGSTIPFGTNATAAITDAYETGSTFTLSRTGIEGGFTPVPEPATWVSTGALLLAGLVFRRWRPSRKQGAGISN
jgi:hypothetical protein